MNIIKNIKYLNKLKKETNDINFLNEIEKIKTKIETLNKTSTTYEEKINKHYQTIKKMFLNKKSNDIRYLKTKKMAYEYHLYLLNNYYNEMCKTKFLEKLSN
jgi:rubrerythrin